MKLLVVCEPKFDVSSKLTVNLAMNEILKQYQLFFDEVHCLCPGELNQSGIHSDSGIVFHTVDYYKGSKINKISAILKGDKKFLRKLVEDFGIDIIQYRIPSFFSLGFYYCYKSVPAVKTTYIAGDMYENLLNNFKKIPFINTIAKLSEKLQNSLVKNSIVVSTGDVLAEKYKSLNSNIHPYYSTTHNDILENTNIELGNTLKIVFLGRIDEAKRLSDLVEAVKILDDSNYRFIVNIIGDGPSLNSIKKMVTTYGLLDYFNFHGYVSEREKIDAILLDCHAIVLPSVTEGTAKVLPEAMSRGVIPFAVRGVGSNNYIISDGQNGFLFEKHNTQDLANKFLKLLSSNKLYLDVRANCYLYAQDRTASKEIKKMWEFVLNNIK